MLKGLLANTRIPVFVQIDLKNATILIKDGSTPQNQLEIKIGEGNFTYAEKKPREYVLNKGALDSVRDGDEEPVDVSFEFTWEWITNVVESGGVPTVEDALKQRGNAADWESSDADACASYCVDLEIHYVPACSDGTYTETILLADFRYEDLPHDLGAGQISCTGKCNITEATPTRKARSTGS